MRIVYTNIDGKRAVGTETADVVNDSVNSYTDLLFGAGHVVSGWAAGNSATIAQYSDHVISVANITATAGYAYRSVATVVDTFYLVRATAAPGATELCKVSVGTTAGATDIGVSAVSSLSVVHDVVFKASGTITYVSICNTSGGVGAVSRWSKIEVVELETAGSLSANSFSFDQFGAVIEASDAADTDNFGRAVALSSDATVLVIGAQTWEGPGGTDRGGAYVYDWSGSAWTQRGSVIKPSDAADVDYFGISVALSSDATVLAIGASGHEGATGADRGGVYVYDWSGSAWTQRGSVIEASDAADFDYFGISVALSSDATVLVIGASGHEGSTGTNRGGVYVYDWSGSAWTQRGSVIEASDAADTDNFGVSVALSSDATVLVIGAQTWEGSTGTNRGGVYVYDWSGSAWTQRGSVIEASDAADVDYFGISVALSSDATVLAIGAHAREGATGADRGGVYVYDWSGSAWTQRGSVIEASDAADVDYFGISVALSSDATVLVIGASGHEGATGTNRGGVYAFIHSRTIIDDNGNVFAVRGEIVKVPVFYGSTTVAFANFSSSNYLELPYLSAFDPDVGDMSMSLWFNSQANSSDEYLVARDSLTTGKRYCIKIDSSGYVDAHIDDATTDRIATSSTTELDDYSWHHVAVTYDASSGTVNLYIDSALSDSVTGAVLSTLTNASAFLTVGCNADFLLPFSGLISMLKIDIGNAWTANQIQTMYNSEHPLFSCNEEYREFGGSTELIIDIKDSTPSEADDFNAMQSIGLTSRQTIFNGTKNVWDIQSSLIPVTSETEPHIKQVRRFIDAAKRGGSFIFDEQGETYYNYDQRDVFLVSKNHSFSRVYAGGINHYKFSFKIQER